MYNRWEAATVFHQLFICSNAQKLWNTLQRAIGLNIPMGEAQYAAHISVSNNYLAEILKSGIFKLLLQIDRSQKITIAQL